MDNLIEQLDEAQARLDELSSNTLKSYDKKSKESIISNTHKLFHKDYHNEPKKKIQNTLRKRYSGVNIATKKLTKEDTDLQEQTAELNELSKTTLKGYTAKAIETVAGRGRKSAKKIKRVSSVDLAKEKLGRILDREHTVKENTRNAHALDIQQHFNKEAPKMLEKHGFSRVHMHDNHTVYHKGHDNGHSTLVRLTHTHEDNYRGSKFSMNSTSGAGTLNGHNHIVDHGESAEHNKTKMMNGFEQHLISDHDHHKRWVTEGVEQTGEFLEEGRRGRPPKDAAKRAAFNSAETDEPKMHIIAQLNKVKDSSVPTKVQFKDGSKHDIHSSHAEQILSKYSNMKPNDKIEFQKRVAASHASFKAELK